MPSLTPLSKSDQVVNESFNEGIINGALAFIPSLGALFLAMKNPRFLKVTNVQSRTALAIMPPLFVFGFTAETGLQHRMEDLAKESQHSYDAVYWAERQKLSVDHEQQQKELNELYKRAVYESGLNVVPGDRLALHQEAANFVAENPFKVLAGIAVPSVAWIFIGRTGANNQHLNLAMKLMHTRVFGQFAVISTLLGVMGFKEFMDRNGKYITEADAQARVDEMHRVRQDMLLRLEARNNAQKVYEEEIRKAHEQDVMEGHASEPIVKKHHKKKHHHQKDARIVEEASAVAV